MQRPACHVVVVLLSASALLSGAGGAKAAMITVEPWAPLFKGIDFATGRQQAVFTGERNQAVSSLRIDLADPDVVFFGMPRCTNWHEWGTNEVISTKPTQFLADHGLQVAVNCNFFWPNSMVPGTPTDVYGLAVAQGQVVSPTNDVAHPCAMLFTTNNQPTFIATNISSTNLAGIYTAVSGNLLLLRNGLNVAPPANPQNPDVDPRTALGLSQDGRYLIAVVIDGRQTNYSDGATYYETADWLLRFGAAHGMNVDGGSCSSMVMQDCAGQPRLLNRNSYVETVGHGQERGVGHVIGFYAKPAPAFVREVRLLPSDTTTTVLWRTLEKATTQVEFGLTTNYGSLSAFSAVPVTEHVMTLTGLAPDTAYFYRVLSTTGGSTHTWACRFSTVNFTAAERIFDITQAWKHTTNNLDRTNWQAVAYDDLHWLGPGAALLCVETNADVFPKNTALPPPFGLPIPPCYYFRTRFDFGGDPTGVALLFSNYVDDGAVFYLNGAEIYRLRLPPAPALVTYASLASGYACSNTLCSGDACATWPDVFTVPANRITNLHAGENLLAVEVHNYARGSLDIVFGSALFAVRPYAPPVSLQVLPADELITLYWNGTGLTLQQADRLGTPADWTDAPGPVTTSPCLMPKPGATRFFRLRR
jgi:hypothetical protein